MLVPPDLSIWRGDGVERLGDTVESVAFGLIDDASFPFVYAYKYGDWLWVRPFSEELFLYYSLTTEAWYATGEGLPGMRWSFANQQWESL